MKIQLWLSGFFMLSLIEILSIKYLNNIVEQSHRWVKQKTRQALGWKSFKGTKISLQGKKMWTMIKHEEQVDIEVATPCEQFYALAG